MIAGHLGRTDALLGRTTDLLGKMVDFSGRMVRLPGSMTVKKAKMIFHPTSLTVL